MDMAVFPNLADKGVRSIQFPARRPGSRSGRGRGRREAPGKQDSMRVLIDLRAAMLPLATAANATTAWNLSIPGTPLRLCKWHCRAYTVLANALVWDI